MQKCLIITWKLFLISMGSCFKSILNPSCIDLFQTNNAPSFQNTKTVSTDLSDFHKLVLTVLKTSIVKHKPRELQYRNYTFFDSRKFNRDLTKQQRFYKKELPNLTSMCFKK